LFVTEGHECFPLSFTL